jgi:TPR repeat protein
MAFKNVERNLSKAHQLFQKSATKWDNHVAQYMLGMMYLDGNIVAQNERNALYWFERSEKSGWSLAQSRVAYGHQCCKSTNFEKAADWYEKAIAGGGQQQSNNNEVYDLFGNNKFKIKFSKVRKEIYFSCSYWYP